MRDALARFEALHPYLETLAEGSGREPHDRAVVEAYWTGHPLLERAWDADYRRLLERLTHRGLPRSLAARLADALPPGAFPFHGFHVLFVGVGAVTGHVPTTLPNMDACRVSWGRVEAVEEDVLRVARRPLRWEDRFVLGPEEAFVAKRDPALVPDAREGDVVSLHWGDAVERLDAARAARLEAWSLRALEVASHTTTRTLSSDQPAPSRTR